MERRTVFVTGGNRGIGREVCRALAQRGDRVILSSRGDDGEAVAEQIGARFVRLDVSDDASVARAAEELRRGDVMLDVLINNAGVALDGFDADVARRTIDTNYRGPLRVSKVFAPLLASPAVVVMVSSGLGELAGLPRALRARFDREDLTEEDLTALVDSFVHDVEAGVHAKSGWPSSAYRVSKIALNALTRVLARTLASRGVRVHAVCPGWVQTDMGGSGAPRSVAEGARGIIAAAADLSRTGDFQRDGKPIDW